MATLHHITDSWQGINRDDNKDDVLIIETNKLSLFIVFDGVSSTKGARGLIDEAIDFIRKNFQALEDGSKPLSELFYETNEHVLQKNFGDGASTFVALLIDHRSTTGIISWLGDSRVYGFKRDAQTIKQLTKDHSVPDDISVVTKGLGFDDMKRDDFMEKKVAIDSDFLLCTDGMYEFFERDGEDFLDILLLKQSSEVKNAFKSMIDGDNDDDATYIVVSSEIE